MESDNTQPPEEKAHIEPTPTPEPSPVKKETPPAQQNAPGVIILQWLSYAFWGWLILALLWLMTVILINAILGEAVDRAIPYAVGATLVLLPIAFVCDFFYRKHEPLKKTGVATVIMVIHAVIFALLAITSLIVAVFTGISSAIETSGSNDGRLVVILTSLFVTVLYVAAFVRALNPFKNKKPALFYAVGMLTVTVVLLIASIAGPLATSIGNRSDRLIERSLPKVQTEVDGYIIDNGELPKSLDDIDFVDKEARELVEKGLVTYKSVGKMTPLSVHSTSVKYRYQLCVEYKAAKGTSRGTINPANYSSYANTSSHDAGNTCYKLEQSAYTNTVEQ